MNNWYYSKDGGQQGPVALEQLQQMIQSGEIPSSSLVWKQGMGDWVAAATLEEFGTTTAEVQTSSAVAPVAGEEVSPYAAPSAPVQNQGGFMQPSGMGKMPSSHLAQSIVLTVLTPFCCCCLPLGVAPLVFSILVTNRYGAGDYEGSMKASSTAKTLCLVLWILVGIGLVLRLVGMFTKIDTGSYQYRMDNF